MTCKKINYLLLLCCTFVLQSCMSIFIGTKRPLAMLDAPEGLVVRNKTTGETLPMQWVEWGASSSATQNTATFYLTNGVLTKAKKGTELELTYEGNTRIITPSTKSMTGVLILEGFVSFGTFALIDILTGAGKKFEPNIIDVPAVMNNTPSRSLDEMRAILYSRTRK